MIDVYSKSAYIWHKIVWYTYAQHWGQKKIHFRRFISACLSYCVGFNGN